MVCVERFAGSAFRTVVPTTGKTFRLLSGVPKVDVKIAESGNRREQTFCPDCGTAIYSAPWEEVSWLSCVSAQFVSGTN